MKSSETAPPATQPGEIHNRGRGPEIRGTRITVYSILDCLLENWPPEQIADWFGITTKQVMAAVEYIREYTTDVLREYLQILERSKQGNPPELEAELEAGRAQLQEVVRQIEQVKARAEVEIKHLIQEHREWRKRRNDHAGHHGGQ